MEKGPRNGNAIVFNASKGEAFTLTGSYKAWRKRLRGSWRILSLKDEITSEKLFGVKLWITAGPREKFSAAEFLVLKKFLEDGGAILVMLREGGESRSGTNINFLLEEYGIVFNNDAVVRNVYYKYHHPKEALISDGVLNRGISEAARKTALETTDEDGSGHDLQALTFVYPFGATLNVIKPAVAVLSTGSVCFPLNRPILAFYQHEFAEVVDKKVEDEARDRGSLSGRAEKLVRRKTKSLGAKKRYGKEQQQKVKEWKGRAENAV